MREIRQSRPGLDTEEVPTPRSHHDIPPIAAYGAASGQKGDFVVAAEGFRHREEVYLHIWNVENAGKRDPIAQAHCSDAVSINPRGIAWIYWPGRCEGLVISKRCAVIAHVIGGAGIDIPPFRELGIVSVGHKGVGVDGVVVWELLNDRRARDG